MKKFIHLYCRKSEHGHGSFIQGNINTENDKPPEFCPLCNEKLGKLNDFMSGSNMVVDLEGWGRIRC